MSAIHNDKGFSALIVQSPKVDPDFWSGTASACTEAGPRPGQAIPDQTGTRAVPSTHGESSTTVYSLQALRGGNPGYGSWGWAIVTGGVVGTYAGLNFPNFAQDIRNSGCESAATVGTPAVVTTSSGRVVEVWCQNITASSVKSVCCSYSDDLITWVGYDASIKLISTSSLAATYYGVAIDNVNCVAAYWDAEREIVQAWVRVTAPYASGFSQVYLFESTDEGATWSLVQSDTLSEVLAFTYTARSPVVEKVGGALLMLMGDDDGSYDGTHERVTQLVSQDRGRTWIAIDSGLSPYYNLRVVRRNGRLLVSALGAPSDDIYVLEITSAYDLVRDGTWVGTGLGTASTHEIVYIHGKLWALYVGAAKYKVYLYSTDATLDSWEEVGHHPISFESATTAVDIDYFRATPALGGIAAAFSFTDTGVPSAERGRLYTARLGGWSCLTLPATRSVVGAQGRIAFAPSTSPGAYYLVDSQTWYGNVNPTAMATNPWTAAGTGTDTSGMSAGNSPYWSISTAAGQSRYHTIAPTGTLSKGVLCYLDMKVGTGGSLSSNDSAVRIIISDGVTEYNVSLRLTDAGCELHDNIGGADAALTGITPTLRTAFLLAFRETSAGVAATATVYSVGYSAFDAYFNWGTRATLTCSPKTASPAAGFSIERGVIAAGSAVAITQEWYAFHYLMATGVPDIDDLATGFSPATMLYGAPMTHTPTEIRNGLLVSWNGGAAKKGETWSVAPRFDYSKEHVYPQLYPSPRTGWRATGDGSDSVFQWTLNSDDAPEGLGQSAWGIYLQGVNVPEVEFAGYTAAGSWSVISDLDLTAGLSSLPYRVGVRGTTRAPYLTVNMAGTGGATRFIHENEFAGGYIIISGVSYLIDRNTSGTWSVTDGKKPCFFLNETGWDNTIATTGTCAILPPAGLWVINGLGTTEYRRLKITIPAYATYENYHKLDKVVIGPAYIFDKRYSQGRVLGSRANTTTSTSVSGDRTHVNNGPNARYVQFAWMEGCPTVNVYDASREPDYVVIEDGVTGEENALATRGAHPSDLLGLHEWMGGAGWPVVYVADIEPSEGYDQTQCNRDFVYGRLAGDISITAIAGTERHDEVQTVGQLEIQEDV